MAIRTKELKARLERIGVNLIQFDEICGFKGGTMKEIFSCPVLDDEYYSQKILEILETLETEQEIVVHRAIDIVLNCYQDKSLVVFVPAFPILETYIKAGYARHYGSLPRFKADAEEIIKNAYQLTKNIYFFTPFSTDYKEKQVLKLAPKGVDSVVLDPLKIKRQLEPQKRSFSMETKQLTKDTQTSSQQQMETIFREEIIQRILNHRLSAGHYPQYVNVVTYLDQREYSKVAPESLPRDAHAFNEAVLEALAKLKKLEVFEGIVFGCETLKAMQASKGNDRELYIDLIGEKKWD